NIKKIANLINEDVNDFNPRGYVEAPGVWVFEEFDFTPNAPVQDKLMGTATVEYDSSSSPGSPGTGPGPQDYQQLQAPTRAEVSVENPEVVAYEIWDATGNEIVASWDIQQGFIEGGVSDEDHGKILDLVLSSFDPDEVAYHEREMEM